MTERALITQAVVDCAVPAEHGERRVWDPVLIGFCLRIFPSGRKSYCVKLTAMGRPAWKTIGRPGSPWTADEARLEAAKLLRVCATDKLNGRSGFTVGQLVERYLVEGPKTKLSKRASSWKTDRSYLSRHIVPLLGRRVLKHLTAAEVAATIKTIHDGVAPKDEKTGWRGVARIRGGPGAAERTLDSTSSMFSWAIAQGLIETNPAKGLKLPRRPRIERFLTMAEAARLQRVLGQMEGAGELNPVHSAAVRLLLLTGARKSEITGLRWTEVDLVRRRIVLAPDRSKAGGTNGERRIPLSHAAIGIIEAQPRVSEFVLPAGKGSGHFKGLQKTWSMVRERAELGAMRIHDLRHSFASFAVANGENVIAIGKALGHADMRTTMHYLHVADQSVIELADRMGALLAG